MTDIDPSYLFRCIELARLGAGNVAPNPQVGAVLVHEGRIIGEGYHREYGQAHAEVNCINSVSVEDQKWISSATLYVSLEPCSHFGKTPPCSNLIIQKKIPTVVIGCRDPFSEVNGRGIDQLKNAGIEVVTGILEAECRELNKRFFTFHTEHRPYIVLKWAQTANGKIAADTAERLLITNDYTNRLVHQWRTEEAAILVGTNTALHDNPSLDNRLWTGHKPIRLVLDMSLRLPLSLKIFDQLQKTIVFNGMKHEENGHIRYYLLHSGKDLIEQLLDACFKMGIQSVLVEGGAQLLQSFISSGYWDEARVITNEALTISKGLDAPTLPSSEPLQSKKISTDIIRYYIHQPTPNSKL